MATKVNFTVKQLAELKPPAAGELVLYDAGTNGALAVRLRASGGKTFCVRYRVAGAGVAGSPRWFTIGPADKVPLPEARKAAVEAMLAARAGRDPAGERRSAALASTGDKLTLGELIERFEAKQQAAQIKSAAATAKRLRGALAGYKNTPADELTRRHFVEVLEAATPGTAPTLQSNIHSVLGYAHNAGLIPVNVMAGYKKPRATVKQRNQTSEQDAGVMLEMPEVAALWRACGDLRVNRAFGGYVRLLIISGCRRDELAHAERSWLKAATPEKPAHLIVPGKLTKNGRSHFVPLPPLALSVIAQSPQIAGSALLFPGGVSRKSGDIAKISGWSKTWPKVLKVAESYGLKRHCTLHDLRRTMRSHYARLGVVDVVAELQLNHVSADKLALIYQKHGFERERYEAAAQWCGEIETELAAAAPVSGDGADVVGLRPPVTPARSRRRTSA